MKSLVSKALTPHMADGACSCNGTWPPLPISWKEDDSTSKLFAGSGSNPCPLSSFPTPWRSIYSGYLLPNTPWKPICNLAIFFPNTPRRPRSATSHTINPCPLSSFPTPRRPICSGYLLPNTPWKPICNLAIFFPNTPRRPRSAASHTIAYRTFPLLPYNHNLL